MALSLDHTLNIHISIMVGTESPGLLYNISHLSVSLTLPFIKIYQGISLK